MSATAIIFPKYIEENGVLCVFEAGQHVPFDIHRVFTVSAMAGDIRGDHAHHKCSQLLVCVSGVIRVQCDDGKNTSQHLLNSMNKGLLIPPRVWAREEYMTDGAVMMVFCDRVYEEEDYIREYNEFKSIFE
jgi:dTDP-4-dehydrorhamnose 3,5-epimerase-like enzyme